jgi:hypothetical protein
MNDERVVRFVRRRRRRLLEPLDGWTEQEATRWRATAALILASAAAVVGVAALALTLAEHLGIVAPVHPATVVFQTVVVSPSPTPTPWPWP